MNNWFRRSIKNKLTVLVLLAVVPSVLLASLISEWRESGRRLDSKRNEIAGIAAALAATVSEPLATGNQRQTANALKGIGAIPDITHVAVADANGSKVFQFGAGILVSAATSSGSVLDIATYPVVVPVVHAGQEIGRLTLVADLTATRAGFYRSLYVAALAALASAIAGLVASHRMQSAIAEPIATITGTMRAIASTRDFSHEIEKTTSDETGVLVESFNAMLAEIRDRDDELARYHQGLEKLVDERTRDLAVATREAEQANAAKSEFLATMSHEIRTPMNGMLVMAELLAASDLGPRARRQCDVILRSGQTLLAIINDILDLSKIEAGKMTLERLPVDPVRIIDDTLRLFSERAAEKGLQMASYVGPGVPDSIDADPVRLGQVLSNLVNNALKFTGSGGVTVRLQRVADRLRFSVVDTGIGIAKDKIDSIFDPFTQAEQSTTRRFGGTGIGLTICRRLVEAMGGELAVRSSVGTGSEFWFEIPVDPPDAPEVEADRFDGTLIVVAEAGPIRDIVALVARDLGLDPLTLDVAADDLRKVHTSRVIVTAVPAGATTEVFEVARDSGVPAIALSRFGDASAERLLRDGVVRDAIELPLAGKEMRAALRSALTGGIPLAMARTEPTRTGDVTLSFAGARILAADDSAINREVLLKALRRLGADVTFVEDGASAVAAVQSGTYGLVFMDGSMPVMDGFAATRAIRAWEVANKRAPLPVVGLSAHVASAAGDVWQLSGMSDFITKPFTLASIGKCLERWLEKADVAVGADGCDDHCPEEITPPSTGDDRILDRSVLESIAEMQAPGDDLVGRVAGLYLEHAPRALKRLADQIADGAEPNALAASAHALKSLSRNVGARQVGDLCGQIEYDARLGLTPRVPIDLVETALHDAVTSLHVYMTPRPPCPEQFSP